MIRRKRNRKPLWIAGILFLLLVPAVLLAARHPSTVQAAWFDTNWGFRTRINIPSHTTSENNVYVTVPAFNATDTSRFQADCGDLRFTDQSGKQLHYYVVSCGASSTVHVLFGTLPAGETNYYMYYGNPGAANGFDNGDFVTAATGLGAQATATEETGAGPVAYWKFDEGTGQIVDDSSSQQNNGTLGATSGSESTDPTWVPEDRCLTGKCINLDGTSQYVQVNDPSNGSLDFGTGNFTVSLWEYRIKSGVNILIGKRTFPTAGWVIYFNNNILTLQTSDGSGHSYTMGTLADFNIWHHITIVVKRSTNQAYYYLDGVQQGNAVDISTTTGSLSNATWLGIGRDSSDAASMFGGKIDDVKIYNYARTAAQVQIDFNNRGSLTGTGVNIGLQSSTFLNNGLVGYWKMDEATWSGTASEVVDSSGNSVSGAAQGTTGGKAYPTLGKFSNGGFFDGVDDYISIPTTAGGVLDPDTLTVSAWIKPTDVNAGTRRIFQRTSSTYGLFQSGATIQFVVVTGSNVTISSSSLTAGTWAHIVGTYDGTIMRLYVNGVQVNTGSQTGAVANGSTTAAIGADPSNVQFFYGTIDDVRVYNRALSAGEVTQLYNWAPGPIAWWKMEEGTGTTFADSSGNGLNGVFGSGTGVSTPTWGIGKYGNALATRTTGYGQANITALASKFNSGSAAGRQFSYSLWFKPTVANSATRQYLLTNNVSCNNPGHFSIGLLNGNIFFYYYSSSGAAQVSQTFTPSTALQNNQWYHLEWTKTFGQTGVAAYLNGVPQTVTGDSALTGYATSQNYILFGAYNGDSVTCTSGVTAVPPVTSYYFTGSLDDIKVYDYVRTPRQVIEDMNGDHPAGGSPVGSQSQYWKLDEGYGSTSNNSISGGYAVTLASGTNTPYWATGKSGKALSFNGTSSYATMPVNIRTMTGDSQKPFTLSAWFKPLNTLPALGIIFGSFGNTVGLLTNTGNVVVFRLQNQALTTYMVSSTALTLNQWHQVTGTFDSNQLMKLYVDGVYMGQTQFSGTAFYGGITQMSLGGMLYSGTMYGPINAIIDEVKVYPYDLTADQVKIDYNANSSLNFGTGASSEDSLLGDGAGATPSAYWNFEENTGSTANDISGNGSNLTLTNPTWVAGKYGSALSFKGGNAANVSDNYSISPTTTGTIEAWVYSNRQYPSDTGSTVFHEIVNKWSQGSCATANQGYFLDWQGTNVLGTLRGFICNGTSSLGITYNTPLTPNTWYHVAFTWDGTKLHLYVNGIEKATPVNQTINNQDDGATLSIGNGFGSNSVYQWDGRIDEVKIYNYARTAAQVAYDYNRGAPVGWWQFDECQGSTLHDASGNSNDGSWAGGTTIGTCTTSSTAWNNGATGKYNSSLSFTAANSDYATVAHNSILNTYPITISAWVKTSLSSGSQAGIVNKYLASSANGYQIYLASGKFCGWYYKDISNYVNGGSGCTTSTYNDNNWHLVTYVVDSNGGTIYVDGLSKVTQAWTGTPSVTTTTQALDFGYYPGGGAYFTGQIDDVRIYNYALSASQIKTIYNGGAAVKYAPLTGTP